MNIAKQMANTKFWDLITFLYLFPDAELVCDGDMGIVLLECCVDSPAAKPLFLWMTLCFLAVSSVRNLI
ncbi:MAG: hypothetical protein E6559_22445 [Pantoea sp.]|nr:hypothetical protein [Pantoea sp.]